MAVAVRVAESQDAGKLVQLLEQLGYPTSLHEIRERLENMPRDMRVFVATLLLDEDADAGIAGFAVITIRRTFVEGTQAILEGLVVADGLRSKGIGAALLSTAERWASERGAPLIHVKTNVVRERAHAFYRRNGYSLVKTQHCFEKRL